MKTKDLVDLVKDGAKPIVVLNKEIEKIESADPGMMGRIIGFGEIDDWGGGSSTIEVMVDFSEFEIHNKNVAIPNWAGDDGEFNKTWFETGAYPKNGVEKLYLMLTEDGEDGDVSYFDLKENNYLIESYLKVKDKFKSYVDYLEKLAMSTDGTIKKVLEIKEEE